MKSFTMHLLITREDEEIYAETEQEAREKAVEHYISIVKERLVVYELKGRTERCGVCQYTYPPSEIIKRDGEQLCGSCHWDKYQYEDINLEDIPF